MASTLFVIFSSVLTSIVFAAIVYFVWTVWRGHRREMNNLKEFADTLPGNQRSDFWRTYRLRGMFWHLSNYPDAVKKHRVKKPAL